MVHAHPSAPSPIDSSSGLTGCFMNLAGGIGGFSVLVIVGVLILREHAWTFTAKDLVYWSVVVGMLVTRFAIERTQESAAAPLAMRSYATMLLPAAGVGWLIAQSFRV